MLLKAEDVQKSPWVSFQKINHNPFDLVKSIPLLECQKQKCWTTIEIFNFTGTQLYHCEISSMMPSQTKAIK